MIDGNAAPAPVISGATATFNLGGLANGPHTLGGRLVDAVGKSTPFLLHVTIQPAGTPPGAQAYVEKNTKPGQATTLVSADGGISVTMPADGWPTTGGAEGDWIILRVDPSGLPHRPQHGRLRGALACLRRDRPLGPRRRPPPRGFGRSSCSRFRIRPARRMPITSDAPGVWR